MFDIGKADGDACLCRNCGGRFPSNHLHELSVTKGNTTVLLGIFCDDCINELKDTLECYSRG